MDKAFGQPDPVLRAYVEKVYQPEDEILVEVRRRSDGAGLPPIAVSALDGRHLTVLAAATGALRAVEIGTLGGYSGICLLRGMPPGGLLYTFELEAKNAEVARQNFRWAGVEPRVRIHVGPAASELAKIEKDGPFDLVFIDADKVSYPTYLAWAEANLRAGGLVVLDNAFLFGELARPPEGERAPAIRAMQATHEALARNGKWIGTVLPTGEGLAVGVRVRNA